MKKTNEQFLNEVYNLVKNDYTFKEKYKNAKTKILVQHNVCGYNYYVSPTNFLSGTRCPACAKNFKDNSLFLKEVEKLVGNEYEVLDTYISKRHEIFFKHNTCGTVFKKIPETFLIGRRCPKCGLERRSKENHYKYNPNLTQEDRAKRDMFKGKIKKWRNKVFARDNYKCRKCSKKGKLNAHHIMSWDKNINERFDVDNGVTLCEECHKSFHSIYGYGDNNKIQFLNFLNCQ